MYREKLIIIFFCYEKSMVIFLQFHRVKKEQQKAIAVLLRLPFVVLYIILRCRSPPSILIFTKKNKSKSEDDMRKFQNTENKYSKGILYKVSDGYIEVTVEQYLKENPDKTAQDFMELKRISDEIYYKENQEESAYAKRKEELKSVEEIEQVSAGMFDLEIIKKMEEEEMKQAVKKLLEMGNLTLIQKRRFYLHFYEGMSYRQIAKLDGVHFTSVQESIEVCVKKLKKIYRY